MSTDALPRRKLGRPTAAAEAVYAAQVEAFADRIQKVRSRLDFEVSSRGWCYILESEIGLSKGDFDDAQDLINDCRKSGLLPLDICAADEARTFDHVESIDSEGLQGYVEWVRDQMRRYIDAYTPVSFWDDKPAYLQMLVEKIDLKSLFAGICRKYRIPTANAKGWSDLNQRADMMRRFAEHEKAGRECILLYCGDHDPAGLRISGALLDNMRELSPAVGWSPDRLTIDRFGLNADFIEAHRLTWIDNLKTGSGKDLASPKHKDHHLAYVQDYLARFGARKVEANALVVNPKAGRALCEASILKYLDRDAPERYAEQLVPHRAEARVLAFGGAA